MFNSAHLGLICLTSRWTVLLSTPAGAHVYSPESETSNLMSNFYCHANTFIVLTSYFVMVSLLDEDRNFFSF